MGVSVAAGNIVSFLLTIAFARILGADDYGSLAALISAWVILAVPGIALQATVARDVGGAAGGGREAEATRGLPRWIGATAGATLGLSLVAALLREPLATLLAVDDAWAAWAIIPTAGLWAVVSIQRGALQGLAEYAAVGRSVVAEALGRLAFGLLLVAAGLDVFGAFFGHTLALLGLALALGLLLRRRLGTPAPGAGDVPGVRALLAAAGAPATAAALLALLQNVDIIVVKQTLDETAAGIYSAASLLAKAIVWLAYGLGLYLLPEASRRATAGVATRPLLARTLGLTGAAAAGAVLVFALGGEQLLELLFGTEYGAAADALVILGVAMALLAFTHLGVQHLLAIRLPRRLWLLAIAAVAEPLALAAFATDIESVALALAAVQLLLAGLVVGPQLVRR
jgi:O-antigen/teichoic acid export membrane protein